MTPIDEPSQDSRPVDWQAPDLKPIPGQPSQMTPLNRAQLRAMGLSSANVAELFADAQAKEAAKGCTCGVLMIVPKPADRKRRIYDMQVKHRHDCPMDPARAAELATRAQRRPAARLRRALRRG